MNNTQYREWKDLSLRVYIYNRPSVCFLTLLSKNDWKELGKKVKAMKKNLDPAFNIKDKKLSGKILDILPRSQNKQLKGIF